MPERIKYHRPAGVPGASALYRKSRFRAEDNTFYGGVRWQRLRKAFRASNPLCADCLKRGRTTAAQHVHHKQPRKTHPDLAYEWSNLESLCAACHNARDLR